MSDVKLSVESLNEFDRTIILTDWAIAVVINNVTKNATMKKWLDEYSTTGKPIMGKYATPEDIIYIKRDIKNTAAFAVIFT